MRIQDESKILYIHFISSHKEILGNELADQASKEACKFNVINACDVEFEEHFISLK